MITKLKHRTTNLSRATFPLGDKETIIENMTWTGKNEGLWVSLRIRIEVRNHL